MKETDFCQCVASANGITSAGCPAPPRQLPSGPGACGTAATVPRCARRAGPGETPGRRSRLITVPVAQQCPARGPGPPGIFRSDTARAT